jgi:hypothetical protein
MANSTCRACCNLCKLAAGRHVQCAPVPALARPLGFEHTAAACEHGHQRDEQEEASKRHIDDVNGMVLDEPYIVLRSMNNRWFSEASGTHHTFLSPKLISHHKEQDSCLLQLEAEVCDEDDHGYHHNDSAEGHHHL